MVRAFGHKWVNNLTPKANASITSRQALITKDFDFINHPLVPYWNATWLEVLFVLRMFELS